jgi:hypothetical protein
MQNMLKNQLLTALFVVSIAGIGLTACQNQSQNNDKKIEIGESKPLLTKKTADAEIELNDIWLLKDTDLEKGEVLKFYKVIEIQNDSIRYIKSKINIDTTINNWQAELSKQLNYDVNIKFRVNKNVKEKWLTTQRIIGIYKK